MRRFRTASAVSRVMLTMSSTVGSVLTVVSAKNMGPFLVWRMYIPATLSTPWPLPITCKAGRITLG